MNLSNTLTRRVEKFVPGNDNKVTMYSCGPTVYDSQTIGNWTAYVRWDTLARTLVYLHYNLVWYMNITDVGHLTSDEDSGEDKLQKGARRENTTAWVVASKYTAEFEDGLRQLNITLDLTHLVKATDNIPEQIALIQRLERGGHTYVTDDGVYFDSSTFPEYGKLAQLDISGLKAGVRVEMGEKRHPTDFALWKFSANNEQRDMEWDSPWGKGFPGWHIECSAMAMKYLGETIDIHTGGIDHIPIHHTNEIAQSESATGKKFVRYWVHSNFMKVNGQKFSKSLGNGYTLADLREKGFSPLDFRLFVLQSSYHSETNFTWTGLESAKHRRTTLQAMADLRFQYDSRGKDIKDLLEEVGSSIVYSMQDDINSPSALAALSKLVDEATMPITSENANQFEALLATVDDLLGLDLRASSDITPAQKKNIAEREAARQNNDWKSADQYRQELLLENIIINDTPIGPLWRRT